MLLFDVLNAMLVIGLLALVPSSSSLLVATRTISRGRISGAYTAIGVAFGDFILIVLAITGLSTITLVDERVGALVRVIGGAYLIWIGCMQIRHAIGDSSLSSSYLSSSGSFVAGLLLTLADIKAIFFYMSLLPAYIDLEVLSLLNVVVLSIGAAIAVAGAKLVYVISTDKARLLFGTNKLGRSLEKTTGGLLILIGVWLWFMR